jgi:uncharacterized protein (TIGR02466 family)
MPKTIDIFPQTIYEVEYSNFEEIQPALITHINTDYKSQLIDQYVGHDHPIRSGAITKIFDSNDNYRSQNPIEDQNLKSIIDFITEHGRAYWQTLNLSSQLTPYVLQLWVNSVGRGGFVASHNHNPVPISGVFYIKAEPKQGNLFLENPLDLVLGRSALDVTTKTPTRFNYEIESITGKLVLFPGWMKHFTRPNDTDESRISMAVNFGCQGQVGFTEFI